MSSKTQALDWKLPKLFFSVTRKRNLRNPSKNLVQKWKRNCGIGQNMKPPEKQEEKRKPYLKLRPNANSICIGRSPKTESGLKDKKGRPQPGLAILKPKVYCKHEIKERAVMSQRRKEEELQQEKKKKSRQKQKERAKLQLQVAMSTAPHMTGSGVFMDRNAPNPVGLSGMMFERHRR